MPGLGLMSYKGPVYAPTRWAGTSVCESTTATTRSAGLSWCEDTASSATVPYVKDITLDTFLPTMDEIQEHECAMTLIMLAINK